MKHKLFAVFTAPDGHLLFRKMWSRRLAGYLSGVGAMKDKGWEEYMERAKVGESFHVPLEGYYSWMVIVRIRDGEDKGDTE